VLGATAEGSSKGAVEQPSLVHTSASPTQDLMNHRRHRQRELAPTVRRQELRAALKAGSPTLLLPSARYRKLNTVFDEPPTKVVKQLVIDHSAVLEAGSPTLLQPSAH